MVGTRGRGSQGRSFRRHHRPCDEPADAARSAEATVYRFVSDLQTKKRIDDATYKAALDLLGAEGVTELVFLAGYYATISHILNAFEVGLPSGQAPIFKG